MTDDTNDYQRWADYLRLTDELMDTLPKELIAEVARILAMNVAHYQAQYGELPLDESILLLNAETLDDGAAKLLANGMQTLAGVIGLVMGAEGEGGKVH